ncbi:MAG: hypothetical protein OXE86_21825 [Alphaproteobacteria bacterium]|nr:hypothetical protein [Alphaproteobacteria bacterium]
MGIKLVIAVTDSDWFSHLRQRPDLREVNFWSPSPRAFKACGRANCSCSS